MPTSAIRISKYLEALQAQGYYSFSCQALVLDTGKSEKAVERALSRLRQHGVIASPRKGFYVIIPPEYRASGCLPATWFVDSMMSYVNEPYYVGLLSAAELYGAAHHRPQEFHVVTGRSLRQIECGRTRIRFFSKRHIEHTPTIKHNTRTGYMHVSTPEATALDLVRYSFELGGLNSVAVIIGELAEHIKPGKLVRTAKGFELSVAQRLGFILDQLNKRNLSDPLSKWIIKQSPRLILLRSDGTRNSTLVDERWRLKVNTEIELEA